MQDREIPYECQQKPNARITSCYKYGKDECPRTCYYAKTIEDKFVGAGL